MGDQEAFLNAKKINFLLYGTSTPADSTPKLLPVNYLAKLLKVPPSKLYKLLHKRAQGGQERKKRQNRANDMVEALSQAQISFLVSKSQLTIMAHLSIR